MIHFNRIIMSSAPSFGERVLHSQTSLQTKILAVALLALGCLVAYLYYTFRNSKLEDKLSKFDEKDEKKIEDVILDSQEPPQELDLVLKEDPKIVKKSPVIPPKKPEIKTKPQPKPAVKQEVKILPDSASLSDEDANLLAAIVASQNELPPKESDFEKAIRQSEEEALKRQEEELARALELSIKEEKASKPSLKAIPSPPKSTPSPTKGSITDDLLKTTSAKSDHCDKTLELALEKAKSNKNIKFLKYEIKRNDQGHAYLELHFANAVHRNLAAEELRSHYSMFQTTGTPTKDGSTILRFSVEQTIEFENKF